MPKIHCFAFYLPTVFKQRGDSPFQYWSDKEAQRKRCDACTKHDFVKKFLTINFFELLLRFERALAFFFGTHECTVIPE